MIANSQTLHEILQNHYEAVGIEYLKEIQTIQYTGTFYNHFLKSNGHKVDDKFFKPDFKLYVERNMFYLINILGYHGEDIHAFSKGQFWRDTGGGEPEHWNPSAIDRLKIQLFLDFEGFLFNWSRKGYKLEKYNDVSIDNTQFHRIKVVTPENDILFFYLNTKNYLISKISFFGDLIDNPKQPSFTYSEYKKIGKIKFAFNRIFKTQMFEGPNGYQEIVIDNIKINPKFNNNIFDLNYRISNIKNQ